MTLLAGVARADITPAPGTMKMAGYASRTTPAVGVHDDLTTTVLFLEKDGVSAAIVGLDILGMDFEETAAVRACCAEVTGIPAESVFLSCSHTHGGSLRGPGDEGGARAAYAEMLRWKVAGALFEARRQAVPARVGHARAEAHVAGNRRERRPDGTTVLGYNPDGPTARFADVLRVDTQEGAPLAVLFQYACHGTALTGNNYHFTADYPGVARRFIERNLPGTRALFVAGCGGNQNPYPRGTFALAERHGTRLGAAVVRAALDIEATGDVRRLAVTTHHAALPLAELPPLATCRSEADAAGAAAEAERAQAAQRARESGEPLPSPVPLSRGVEQRLKAARERLAAAERGETDLTLPMALQVVALDDLALVSLPGEVFFEIGEAIREASPFAVTFPSAYANGYIGYVPTGAEVPFGGYEVCDARARRHGLFLRDDADAALIEAAVAALNRTRE